MTIRKRLKIIGKETKGILGEVKNNAYRVASRIEQTVVGEGGLIDDAKYLAGHLKNTYKKYGSKTGDKIKGVSEDIQSEVAVRYNDFKKMFYNSNGKFDYGKAKTALSDDAESVKKFGKRAVKDLSDLVKKGAKAVEEDYRKHIPSDEEKAGIGDEYKGVITRKHLEDCKNYEKKAKNNLPGGLKVRSRIIKDLRSHAITNKSELKSLYKKGDTVFNAVNKYIK